MSVIGGARALCPKRAPRGAALAKLAKAPSVPAPCSTNGRTESPPAKNGRVPAPSAPGWGAQKRVGGARRCSAWRLLCLGPGLSHGGGLFSDLIWARGGLKRR